MTPTATFTRLQERPGTDIKRKRRTNSKKHIVIRDNQHSRQDIELKN